MPLPLCDPGLSFWEICWGISSVHIGLNPYWQGSTGICRWEPRIRINYSWLGNGRLMFGDVCVCAFDHLGLFECIRRRPRGLSPNNGSSCRYPNGYRCADDSAGVASLHFVKCKNGFVVFEYRFRHGNGLCAARWSVFDIAKSSNVEIRRFNIEIRRFNVEKWETATRFSTLLSSGVDIVRKVLDIAQAIF